MSNLPQPIGFRSVKKAREALKEKALEILQEFRDTIREARASGKYEEALKAQQWLIDHIPDEDGERLLESSVDKPKQVEQGRGPLVQIGFKLGGTDQARLQEPVIDITPEPDE